MTEDRSTTGGNETTFRLTRSSRAPAAARARTDAWMDTVDVHPAVRGDILLAVSELVTNAVVHAASAPSVHLAAVDHHIRLEVHDDSDDQPVRRDRSTPGSSAGGFGMRLVDELASEWGWATTSSGKVVWAEFERARDHSVFDPAASSGP